MTTSESLASVAEQINQQEFTVLRQTVTNTPSHKKKMFYALCMYQLHEILMKQIPDEHGHGSCKGLGTVVPWASSDFQNDLGIRQICNQSKALKSDLTLHHNQSVIVHCVYMF